MEVLNKLTKKNMSKNKQRTAVTIVGIVLSCALITAVYGLVVSAQSSIMQASLDSDGNRHVTFYDVPNEEIKDIIEHKEVASYYLTDTNVAFWEDRYIGVNGVDAKGLGDLEKQLEEGSVPKDNTEIVVDVYFAAQNNIDIGDEINFPIGERMNNGQIVTEYSEDISNEEFQVIENKKYKVVGFANYYSYLSTHYENNFYTYDENIDGTAHIHLLYHNPENYNEITAGINGTSSDMEPGKYMFSYNSEYLRWAGYMVDDSTREVIYTVAAIVSIIIIITSVFCIRNSFAISVSEKTRLYGMLSSVGATPKQIKRSVLKEGWYLGIIGIPLGLIAGNIATYILVIVVNYFMPSLQSTFAFAYKFTWEPLAVGVVLSSVTIYLSAIHSAKKAGKITEIEAIKNQNELKFNSKKAKVPKIIKALFKTGGVIAYKSMRRNKSKYRTTIVSLAVSIMTFVALSYYMELGFATVGDIFKDASFSLAISNNSGYETQEEVKKIYEDISNMQGVDSFSLHNEKQIKIAPSNFDERFTDLMSQSEYLRIISLNQDAYEKFVLDANLELSDVENKGILVNNSIQINESDGGYRWQNIVDESIESVELVDDSGKKVNIEFVTSETVPMGGENFQIGVSVLVLEEELFKSIEANSYYQSLYINSNNTSELQTRIYEFEEENDVSLSIFNVEDYLEMQNNLLILIAIFLYGFIIVITLIGLTNIFNTITTNMKLRAREFATLNSIGMTGKEFKHMIRVESIFYGAKSLFWGLAFGMVFSYIMYWALKNSDMMNPDVLGSFTPPYIAIASVVVFVFLVINMIMRYSLSKINKQNMIETIRNENI